MKLLFLFVIPCMAFGQNPLQTDTTKTSAADIRVVSTDAAVTLLRKIDLNGTKAILSISSQPACWRLVHNGKRVINLFYSSGVTHTINKLECFKTYDECAKEVKNLGLIIDKNSQLDSTNIGELPKLQIK